MKITKKLIIALSIVLLSVSCRTKIVCSEVRRATIDYLPFCDISFKFNRCRCRCFDINNYNTVDAVLCGEDFIEGDFALEYCDGIAGFYVEDWATRVRPNVIRLSRIKKDYCR